MTPNNLLFAWPLWLMQSMTRPLVDLTDLVDVNLSDLLDITIQTENFGTTGNPAIEREVYASVARAGKQLGCIADAVLELADKTGQKEGKKVNELQHLVNHIDHVKRKTAKVRAEKCLAELKKIDREGFDKLIESEMRNSESQPLAQTGSADELEVSGTRSAVPRGRKGPAPKARPQGS